MLRAAPGWKPRQWWTICCGDVAVLSRTLPATGDASATQPVRSEVAVSNAVFRHLCEAATQVSVAAILRPPRPDARDAEIVTVARLATPHDGRHEPLPHAWRRRSAVTSPGPADTSTPNGSTSFSGDKDVTISGLGATRASFHLAQQLAGATIAAGTLLSAVVFGRLQLFRVQRLQPHVTCARITATTHFRIAVLPVRTAPKVPGAHPAPSDSKREELVPTCATFPPHACPTPDSTLPPAAMPQPWAAVTELMRSTIAARAATRQGAGTHLQDLVQAVAPQAYLLLGAPGVGKTRVTVQLLHWAATHQAARTLLVSVPAVITAVDKGHGGAFAAWFRSALQACFAEKRCTAVVVALDDLHAVGLRVDKATAEADSAAPRDTAAVCSRAAALLHDVLTMCHAANDRAGGPPVLVVATATTSHAVAPTFTRAVPFAVHHIAPLTESARVLLVNHHLRMFLPAAHAAHVPISRFASFLAAATAGLTPATIVKALRSAVLSAASSPLGLDHLRTALATVHSTATVSAFASAVVLTAPSRTADTAATAANAAWGTVGGYQTVKTHLMRLVTSAAAMKALGMPPTSGIILHGPSGCGKTLIAHALGRATGRQFVSVRGPELMSMYIGDSEAAVRRVFARARDVAPCVLFFDELDAIASKRNMASSTSSQDVYDRVLSTLLNELDGIEALHGVLVLAATSSVHMLDEALLRPGRFDARVLVPPPSLQDREAVLRVHAARMKLGPDVDLAAIAADARLSSCSCAELATLCRDAGLAALRDSLDAPYVDARHFANALARSAP